MGKRRGFTLVELLVVIVIIGLLAALLLPAIFKAICSAKAGTAESLIENLSQAAKLYETDQSTYPPGDGSGSASLATAVLAPGAKGLPYMQAKQLIRTPAGDIVNPTYGGTAILYYARNFPGVPAADAQNKDSFDIWGWGCSGDPKKGAPKRTDKGLVSNWE